MLGQAVLPLQQEDALVGQLLVVERHVQPCRHVGGHHHVEGILADGLAVEATDLHRQGEDQQIELPLLQLLEQIGGGVFPQQQLQLGIGLAAHLQQLAEQEGGYGGDAAEADGAVHDPPLLLTHLHQIPGIGEQVARPRDDFHADRRHDETLVIPLHQLQVHHVLQGLDPGTQGGLADMAGLGGAVEILVLVQSDQILELFQAGPTLHRRNPIDAIYLI